MPWSCMWDGAEETVADIEARGEALYSTGSWMRSGFAVLIQIRDKTRKDIREIIPIANHRMGEDKSVRIRHIRSLGNTVWRVSP